jgi:hypothetical protein
MSRGSSPLAAAAAAADRAQFLTLSLAHVSVLSFMTSFLNRADQLLRQPRCRPERGSHQPYTPVPHRTPTRVTGLGYSSPGLAKYTKSNTMVLITLASSLNQTNTL